MLVKVLSSAIAPEGNRFLRKDRALSSSATKFELRPALPLLADLGAGKVTPVTPRTLRTVLNRKDLPRRIRKAIRSGGKRFIPHLIRLARKGRSNIRKNALSVLGDLGKLAPRKVVLFLWRAMKSKRKGIFRAACDGFNRIGASVTVPVFSARLKMKSVAVRYDALNALEFQCDASGGYVSHCTKTDALKSAVRALKSRETKIRAKAVIVLGLMGDKRAALPLALMLKDRRKLLRGLAANSLGEIGDKRTLPLLLAALGDSKSLVRYMTAYALSIFGDTSIVPHLVKFMKGRLPLIKEGAALAMGQFCSDPGRSTSTPCKQYAYSSVVKLLHHKKPAIRKSAAESLLFLKDKRAVKPLIVIMLGDPNIQVRAKAAEALGEIGDSRANFPLRVLLKGSNSIMRYRAGVALAKIKYVKGSNQYDDISKALKDSDRLIRTVVKRYLREINGVIAKKTLRGMLNDLHPRIMIEVYRAVRKLK